MPERPQRAGLGRALLDLVGAAIAARQAMPAHCLEWGGMAGLGVNLVYVQGHVLRLRLGLSKTQNKGSLRLSPLGPVCEGARFAAEFMLWRALLRVVRGPGLVVRIWVVAQLGFEQSLEDCRNLSRLGVVPIVSERQRQVAAAPLNPVMDGCGLVRGDLAFLVAGEGCFDVLAVIARPYECGVLCLEEADAFRRRGELHVHLTKPLEGGLVLSCCTRLCRLSGAFSRPYTGLSSNARLWDVLHLRLRFSKTQHNARPFRRFGHSSLRSAVALTRSNTSGKPLKCYAVNEGGIVGMGIDVTRPTPNFQSEKTGSTPVGSAMISLENLAERRPFRKRLWRPIPKGVQTLFLDPRASFAIHQASALARSRHSWASERFT